MPEKKHIHSFEFSTSGRDDGTIEAVYIRICCDPVVRTVEIEEDILLVDYGANGKLVGIEILAPVRIKDIKQIVAGKEIEEPFIRFVQHSAPRDFVTV